MSRPPVIDRYVLYGEQPFAIAPEFVHMEPISVRSALYEWRIAPHAHPGIYQTLLLNRGSGVLTSDGMEAELRPLSLVDLPSNCVHAFRFAPDAEGWVLSIAADLLGDPRIGAFCDVRRATDGPARWTHIPEGEPASSRLQWVLADLHGSLAARGAAGLDNALAGGLAWALALSDDLLRKGAAPHAPASAHDRLARRFRELVEARFREGWSVERYAAELGITGHTLTRICRARFSRAPRELVLDRLLLEAMRLLTYTAASIGRIADELGFTDPAYFARFFKQRSGMTAGTFRRTKAWFARDVW